MSNIFSKQAAEELEVVHHCSSVLVHQNNPGSDTAFYKVWSLL